LFGTVFTRWRWTRSAWLIVWSRDTKAVEENMAMSHQAHYDGYDGHERVVHHHHHTSSARSSGTAALLEFLPGFFAHIFGIGHIYAGNVATGLVIMFGYWLLLGINIVLCFVLIGLITLPLTWLLFLILSTIAASNAVRDQR